MRTQEQVNEMVETEIKRRFDLVEDSEFRSIMADFCKENNLCTAKEWNENRAEILLFLANKVCGIENEIARG